LKSLFSEKNNNEMSSISGNVVLTKSHRTINKILKLQEGSYGPFPSIPAKQARRKMSQLI
jgi:hypothetical protein